MYTLTAATAAAMESCESFYEIYPSNAETHFAQNNSSSSFIIIKENPLRFENPDEWEVGLSEIFVPGTFYNVYEPFNRGMLQIYRVPRDDHWRWGKDFEKYLNETEGKKSKLVCEISVDPGFYTTKMFCDVANEISAKYLGSFNNKKGVEIALREAENAAAEQEQKQRIHQMLSEALEDFHANRQPTISPEDLDTALAAERETLMRMIRLEWEAFVDNWKPAEKNEPPPPIPEPPTIEEVRRGILKPAPGTLTEISTGVEESSSSLRFKQWQTTPNVSEAQLELEKLRKKVEVVGPVASVSRAGGILQSERPGIKTNKTKDDEKRARYDLLKLKPHTQKLRINLPPAHYIVCKNERVQKLLGWEKFDGVMRQSSSTISESGMDSTKERKSLIYCNTSVSELSRIILPETCDFGRNNRILFTYCNLVKPTGIGNSLCPILRAVDINVTSLMKTPVIHSTFESIQYHPVANSQFLEVHFELLNGLGEKFPFQHGENSILVLHFRRLIPKPHAHQ